MIRNTVPLFVIWNSNEFNDYLMKFQLLLVIIYLTIIYFMEKWWIAVPELVIIVFICCFCVGIKNYDDFENKD